MGHSTPSRMVTAAIADLFVVIGSLAAMEEGVGGQDFVTATLREMGILLTPMRSILIQNGYFVGYKFLFDGGYAVRLAGKNAIEVYDDEGKLLKTVSLAETDKKDAA